MMLNVSDLHIAFESDSDPITVIHDLNFHLHQGDALALVGESGSGKSVTALSLMRLLGRRGKITQGGIWLQGEALHDKSEKCMRQVRGKKMGMIFQDPMTALNPTMRIGKQIAETLILHERLSRRAAHQRAIELLQAVGIAEAEQRSYGYPFQLSGGMRQRVMIAIAIACRPLLLIADEPTTALDALVQVQILDLLHRLRQETGMSLLLITHDLSVAAALCDRIAVMQKGTIVETGSIDAIFKTPQHPYTRALLQARSGNLAYG